MGYAVLEVEGPDTDKNKPPKWLGSGFYAVARDRNEKTPEPYQAYRLRLIDYWLKEASSLFPSSQPAVLVNEIAPVVGGGNFVVATQSQLVSTEITEVKEVARQNDLEFQQLGATTVK